MRSMLVLISAAVLAACQTAAAPPPARYRLIDLTSQYTALYDRTQGQDPAARVAAFRAEIVPLFPAFYRAGRPGTPDTDERNDARIARSFERFADLREGYIRASTNFSAMLAPAIGSFQQALPDATDFGDIYLVHSLGEMDGGAREVDGTAYFVFGADVIARVHAPGTERPFFHHELFHRYQSRWFQGCDQIWCGLWMEGTAVLAAEELNPGATDDQLLLTQPEPIRPAVETYRSEAICTVRAKLNSREGDDWGALFSSDRLNEHLPPRFGYYVGLLAAREVRRTHTLQEIAHMPASEVRPLLEEALAALATCPPN